MTHLSPCSAGYIFLDLNIVLKFVHKNSIWNKAKVPQFVPLLRPVANLKEFFAFP